MYSKTRSGKTAKGSVGIEEYRGRYRLHLPRSLYEGKNKYLSTDFLVSSEGLASAEELKARIEADIRADLIVPGTFDRSLVKYGRQPSQAQLTVIENISKPQVTIKELWSEYLKQRIRGKSPATINGTYKPVTSLLEKVGDLDPFVDILAFHEKLLSVTTSEDQVNRAVMQLSAACNWGIEFEKVNTNPFKKIAKSKNTKAPKAPKAPKTFSPEQRDIIIEAFKNDTRKGINYRHYAPFVEFMFLTGCRPCEAIGLRWGSVMNDCSIVWFRESIVEVSGKNHQRDETKTKVDRKFNCGIRLRSLLQSIKPENVNPNSLVFPSPDGKAILLSNFADRAWTKVLEGVNLRFINGVKMTPYNCRDTFITLQVSADVGTSKIAQWVGNSAEVIERKYLDKVWLEKMRPVEI